MFDGIIKSATMMAFQAISAQAEQEARDYAARKAMRARKNRVGAYKAQITRIDLRKKNMHAGTTSTLRKAMRAAGVK